MPRIPIVSFRDMKGFLNENGFYEASQKGSHIKFSNGIRKCIVPKHKELRKGTCNSILMQSGLLAEDLLEYLGVEE